MRVGLITWNTGHRKTMEVALKLKTSGHEVCLFGFPFKERKPKPGHQPYADRPHQLLPHSPREFAKAYGMSFYEVPGWTEVHDVEFLDYPFSYAGRYDPADLFCNCIAKIIPAPFVEGRTILNCHPGLLPENRGVDALKWSIINGWPIGVTLHKIDEVIDRGSILTRMRVPILSTDTLATFCQRMYDVECDLLANFDVHLANEKLSWKVGDEHPISHTRIPIDIDVQLPEMFEAMKPRLMAVSSFDLPQRQAA